MLAQELRAAAAQDDAQRQRDDEDVVELPRDGDDVGDEVDRQRDVAEQREDHELVAAREPRVGEQPAAQDEAVGDEPRQRDRVAVAPRDDERADEERPHEDAGAGADEDPLEHEDDRPYDPRVVRGGPTSAANAARNRRRTDARRAAWAPARDAAWALLAEVVPAGGRVGVVGAGNGDDVPLRRLLAHTGHVALLDLDGATLRRARKRLRDGHGERLALHRVDVTGGAADAAVAAATGRRPRAVDPDVVLPGGPYDVLVADCLYTQLLYPALLDAQVPPRSRAHHLDTAGQALLDALVARLHAHAPVVVHLHDEVGWWPGHAQPRSVEDVLAGPDHVDGLRTPRGCDVDGAIDRAGARIVRRARWTWPFTDDTTYLVRARVSARPA